MAADFLSALLGANLALAAAILIVLALRGPVRRLAGARAAYALWLIPPLAGAASLMPARQAATLPFEPAPLRPLAEAAIAAIGAVPAEAIPAREGSAAALAIWALGVVLGVALLAWRQHRALQILGPMAPHGSGLFRTAQTAIGPAVVGVWRPRIVIPADFEQRFDPREQALIVAHERAHLAAWDARINALAALVRVLSWFNPLAHLAAATIRIDQEMACDEAVVRRHAGERRLYAGALLKTQLAPIALPLGCQWPARTDGGLKARIRFLTFKAPGRGRRVVGGALVAAAGLGASCAAWAVQPAVAAPIRRAVEAPAPALTALLAPAPARPAARPTASKAAPAKPRPAPAPAPPTRPAADFVDLLPVDIVAEQMTINENTRMTVWTGNVRLRGEAQTGAKAPILFINGVRAPPGLRLDWLKPADRVEMTPPRDAQEAAVLNIVLADGAQARFIAVPARATAPPRPAPAPIPPARAFPPDRFESAPQPAPQRPF